MEIAIAILARLTANIHRDQKEHPEPFELENFLVQWGRSLLPPPETEPADEEDDEAKALAEAEADAARVMAFMNRLMEHQDQLEQRKVHARTH